MKIIGITGEYLYVSHTLLILYLESNHTLFEEKLYFIWKFSSGWYTTPEILITCTIVCYFEYVVKYLRQKVLDMTFPD